MPGFWRKCRIAFRCVRFTVWGVILLLLLAFAWFNVVGLPNFLKTRLVSALRERGVQLEFTRMRLRIIHGLVCDNVRVASTDSPASPELTAREVQLRVNFPALLHRHLQVDGLVLRQGKLAFPVSAQGPLTITNLQGELRILPNETWSLDQFRGTVHDANFNFAGAIVHAPEFQRWKMFAGAKTPDHGSVQASMQNLSDVLKEIHFAGKPQINARLDGDAHDVHSFTFSINAKAPGIQTPWFTISNFEFAAHVLAPTNAPLYSGPARGFWTNLQPFRLDWLVRGTNFTSSMFAANALDCSGLWGDPHDSHTFAVTVNALARNVETPWCSMADFDFATRLLAPTNAPRYEDPAWGFWTNLQPFQADWIARGNDIKSEKLQLASVACSGNWNPPQLGVTELSARLEEGSLDADANLNVASHSLDFNANTSFNPHLLAPFLTDNLRAHFADVSWSEPPAMHVGGTFTLPAWTNQVHPWPGDITSTMKLHGDVAFTNVQIADLGLPVSLRTHFNYGNEVLQLADLHFSQGRTDLKLRGEESLVTDNFHYLVDGRLDSECLLPFLKNDEARRGYHHLQFRQPVSLDLDVAGSLRNFNSLTATGRIAATEFAIRDQWIDSVTATLSYTNLVAQFYNPHLSRSQGKEQFDAEKVTLDIDGEKLFIHGGKGGVLPLAVGRAIGPKTARDMEPYQFLGIPHATVNGCVPLKQVNGDLVTDDADLRFDVIGTTPFRWRKFETPAITGTILWKSHYLIITNAIADCYSGTAHGWGVFDVETPGDGTDFSFFIEGTNVDFNAMGRALWSPTNKLRGALSGDVTVTKANSSDWHTWNGYGRAHLENGLLWDAPVFGMMSPLLNKLTPGIDIGNSRATEANGGFNLTNGVVFTDTLAIRSSGMRLDYVGTVDLEENVNARVRAQILRNTPVIGSIVSVVLTPVSVALECEVKGTLDDPKITPVYIPFTKVLTAPLHPIRTVQQIFSSPATNSAATNTPSKP